jgi:hypothetical protein
MRENKGKWMHYLDVMLKMFNIKKVEVRSVAKRLFTSVAVVESIC